MLKHSAPRAASLEFALEHQYDFRLVRTLQQVMAYLADGLVRRIAVQLLGALVPVSDDAIILSIYQNGIERRIQKEGLLSEVLFGAFAVAYIKNYRNSFFVSVVEHSTGQDSRNPAAVFANELFFIGTRNAGFGNPSQRLLIPRQIGGGRHLPPAYLAAGYVTACVAHHVQKGIVRVSDTPVNVPEDDSEHVGFEYAPMPCLAFT